MRGVREKVQHNTTHIKLRFRHNTTQITPTAKPFCLPGTSYVRTYERNQNERKKYITRCVRYCSATKTAQDFANKDINFAQSACRRSDVLPIPRQCARSRQKWGGGVYSLALKYSLLGYVQMWKYHCSSGRSEDGRRRGVGILSTTVVVVGGV